MMKIGIASKGVKVNTEIIIAGVALFLTVIANIATISYFAGVLKSNQEHQKEVLDIFKEEINQNFKRIEAKQDKHNNIVERVYCTERDLSVIKEKIKVENHRIEDIEKLQKQCIMHKNLE